MTTSTTSSETKTRNLTVFDLMNGARVVGETVPGLDGNCVANPAILTLEKEKDTEKVKISLNPILFTGGALYRVQPQATIASYQCFDTTIHSIYEQTVNGEKNASAAACENTADSAPADGAGN